MNKHWTRRGFLSFMSGGAAVGALSNATAAGPLKPTEFPDFKPLLPQTQDGLRLVEGLTNQLLIAYGDPINAQGDLFGHDNDYLTWVPGDRPDEILLWVNHESIKPHLMNGWKKPAPRKPEDVLMERLSMGGSILLLRREYNQWKFVFNDAHNRRIHGNTPIPFKGGGPIFGADHALGTLANCAGGLTPWHTFLSCEENYDDFYGEVSFKDGTRSLESEGVYGWRALDPRPPEHFGWVVEIEPRTGEAKKLVSLGRFKHECATCVPAGEHCVVYSGDDENDRCLYKFISDKPNSLESGKLYVAQMDIAKGTGTWQLLDHKQNPRLAGHFKDRTEMLVRAREAAILAGGTPLARPEDIEIHPGSGDVFVCLTNNDARGNFHGSILRLREHNNNPLALSFTHKDFATGGEATGFSSPDNMAFDRKGNLWFTCDISESKMHKGKYQSFGNNALFYAPLSGPRAGQIMRMVSAPRDAELTGPCFSPDGHQLFLSVQHPGSGSKEGSYTSNWPGGGDTKPRPGVVVISGPLLDALVS